MQQSSVKKLVLAALFAALTCVATMIIQIRITPNGYVNLGDCLVLLCAWFLPPFYGAAAAGIGSMLADLLCGWAHYAPATFLIKLLMALCAGFLFRRISSANKRILSACIVSAAAAECIMAGGYYIYEAYFLGLGSAALLSMPGNALQAAFGICSATAVFSLLRRNSLLRGYVDSL